ncbi:hypothetical protein LX64_05163 [Chitinophaga skermanii]|uniref:TraG P-loop domain-containing protein n=1 Tax=Chitinophaga skermanii TaxID=331697 RepID=A0A327PY19_9BACT|nr:conjugal transfer protein TraG [Chitinophaga skermanii]RAI97018.1 hypothetical protein LX64_05163 [Chitinophaga skermanii]
MIKSAEIYSFHASLSGGMFITKGGAITQCFKMENPPPYLLDENRLILRQCEIERALRFMPENSYYHKQDVYLKRYYKPGQHFKGETFLERAEMEHLNNRLYLEHTCFICFTLNGLESLTAAYEKNPLSYSNSLVGRDKNRLAEFLDAVEGVVTVLRNLYSTSIIELTEEEVKKHITDYVNGFPGDNGLYDVYCGEHLSIGEARGAFFALCDEYSLPNSIPSIVEDNSLPQANASLHIAPFEVFGLNLRANHVFNQIIYFSGHQKMKDSLQNSIDEHKRNRYWAKEIEFKAKQLEELQQEIIFSDAFLCKAHFSLQVWDKELEVLEKAKDRIRELFKLQSISYYQPSYEGLENIFIGSVIGRENKLAASYFFPIELGTAVCLGVNNSTYKDDEDGLLFNDRLFQIPIRVDLWDEKKVRIPARNSLKIASTGAGKSVGGLSDVAQELQQGYRNVVVEFGRVFYILTKLYPEKTLHIDYDGNSPLGINPFLLKEGLTPDKISMLTAFVLKLWRSKEIIEDTKQYISVTKIIQDYYESSPQAPSFPDFYSYVKDNYREIITRREIEDDPDYFNLKSFIHICSVYMPGGIYENVCKVNSNEDLVTGKDLIVFELTKIKKDPFLVTILLTIIYDVVENKILSDRSIRGKLYLDEYAETATIKDNFSGEDVHSTVAFFYQKLRKENGAICAIIQSPAQLPAGHFTDGIIANTQLLMVHPTTETVYNDIVTKFQITNKAHIELMKSIRNDFSCEKPYSEMFIRFQDHYAVVVRLELSKPRFLAFQSDGKIWKYLTDYQDVTGYTMERAIEDYLKSNNNQL